MVEYIGRLYSPVDTPAQRPYTGAHPARCTADASRQRCVCAGPSTTPPCADLATRCDVQALTCVAASAEGMARRPGRGTPYGATSSWKEG